MKNIKPLRKSIPSPKIPLGFRRSPTFLTIPSNSKIQGSNKHNNHSQLLAVKYSWAEWEIKLEIDMPNRKEWGLKPEESIPWTWALIAHMTCIGNAQNCYGVVDSKYHRVVSCILYSILYWKTISIQWQASRQNKDLPSQHLRKFHCKWNEKRFILIFCTRSIERVWEGQSVLFKGKCFGTFSIFIYQLPKSILFFCFLRGQFGKIRKGGGMSLVSQEWGFTPHVDSRMSLEIGKPC